MVYIVIEIQATEETEQTPATAATIVNTYADRSVAEQKYHQILSTAAVSSVPVHSAVMLTGDGTRIKGETYRHGISPAPVEE